MQDTGLDRPGLEVEGTSGLGVDSTGLESTGLESTGLESTGLGVDSTGLESTMGSGEGMQVPSAEVPSAEVPCTESGCLDFGSEWAPPIPEGDRVATADKPAPPRWLSPSGAAMFEQCSRRWRFKYVDRLPDPPGEAALKGKFAHRVLELVMQLPPRDRTPGEAKDIARRCWPEIETDREYSELGLDEKAARRFRWKAWDAIEGLWRIEDPRGVEVRSTEQEIKTELGGIPFWGIVDRLDDTDDGVVVVDYKSGRLPRPGYGRSRLDQVLLYAAAVTETTGAMPVGAELLYLGQDKIWTRVTRANLDEVVEKLAATWKSINTACDTDEFEASPGPLCGWCPYADRCPEGTAEIAERKARRSAERAASVTERATERAVLAVAG